MTRIGSLFSGAGGLDMAVEAVFGGEVAWHCEIDKAASKVLAAHWPDVPNLGDITTMRDAWEWVERVDVLCGGFPCQDVSVAASARRRGLREGTRSGLWAQMALAIDQLRPRAVVIENVRGLLSARAHRTMEPDDPDMGDDAGRPVLRAIGAVLGDLADLGYDAVWATVSASDVGAPHRRERVFIVAHPQGHSAAIRQWECATRPAPTPTEPSPRGKFGARLNPEFSSWMMGWPTGWVTAVDGITRNDQLRIVGNGVCPQQAAAAISYLLTLVEVAA